MSTTLDLTICVSRFVFSVSIVRSLSFSLRNTNVNIIKNIHSYVFLKRTETQQLLNPLTRVFRIK